MIQNGNFKKITEFLFFLLWINFTFSKTIIPDPVFKCGIKTIQLILILEKSIRTCFLAVVVAYVTIKIAYVQYVQFYAFRIHILKSINLKKSSK